MFLKISVSPRSSLPAVTAKAIPRCKSLTLNGETAIICTMNICKSLFLLVSFLLGLAFVLHWGNETQGYYNISLLSLAVGPFACMRTLSLEDAVQGVLVLAVIIMLLRQGWCIKGYLAYGCLFAAVCLWFFTGCLHEFHYM